MSVLVKMLRLFSVQHSAVRDQNVTVTGARGHANSLAGNVTLPNLTAVRSPIA